MIAGALAVAPHRREFLALLLGLGGGGAALLLVGGAGPTPLAWAACGTVAAATLRWDATRGAWAWLGAVLAALADDAASPVSLAHGAACAVGGALALRALLRAFGFQPQFSRCTDVARFVAAASIAMLVPAALTVLLNLAYEGSLDAPRAGLQALRWWFNAALMTLLIVPPVLTVRAATLEACRQHPWTTLGLLAGATAICATALSQPGGNAWVMLLGLPVIAVAAIRLDAAAAGVLALGLGVSAMLGVAWASPGEAPALAALQAGRAWVYGLLLAGLSLATHALRAEHAATERRVRDARARFRIGLLAAAVGEQERIAQDVRQRLGGDLDQLSLAIADLEARVRELAPQFAGDVAGMREACGRALEATEAVAQGLMPPIERDGDLGSALESLARRVPAAAGVEVTIRQAPGLALQAPSSRDAYRIAQEALNNVLKHARARHAWISLAQLAEGTIELVIEDDGQGMPRSVATADPGVGLRTMRYRAEIAGGELRIEPRPAGGTRVVCRIPQRRPGPVEGEDAPAAAPAERGLGATTVHPGS